MLQACSVLQGWEPLHCAADSLQYNTLELLLHHCHRNDVAAADQEVTVLSCAVMVTGCAFVTPKHQYRCNGVVDY